MISFLNSKKNEEGTNFNFREDFTRGFGAAGRLGVETHDHKSKPYIPGTSTLHHDSYGGFGKAISVADRVGGFSSARDKYFAMDSNPDRISRSKNLENSSAHDEYPPRVGAEEIQEPSSQFGAGFSSSVNRRHDSINNPAGINYANKYGIGANSSTKLTNSSVLNDKSETAGSIGRPSEQEGMPRKKPHPYPITFN